MKSIKKFVCIFSTLLIPLFVASNSIAQDKWPIKPIKVIVAYPAGSMGDLVVRIIQPQLQSRLGVPVVIDNRAGAGGNIGAAAVANAVADGYTLLMTASNNFTANQYLYKNLGYDADKSLVPVSLVVDVPAVVFTNAAQSPNSFKEFVAHSKNSAALNYGSPGSGTPPQLIAETLKHQAGMHLTHIPYKGSPQAVTALMAGEIQMLIAGVGIGNPHVKAGKLKALAYGGKTRSSEMPDVPTLAELGYPDIRASTWWGIAAPAGTPKEDIQKFSSAIKAALATPEVKAKLHDAGADTVGSSPELMLSTIKTDQAYWKSVIEGAGIKLD